MSSFTKYFDNILASPYLRSNGSLNKFNKKKKKFIIYNKKIFLIYNNNKIFNL